jgi:predicted RNase H-like HicB family nuclease
VHIYAILRYILGARQGSVEFIAWTGGMLEVKESSGEQPMTFVVTLETGEDNYIIAECPALPGCISQGKTREEALTNIREAIQGIVKVRQQHGMPVPAADVVTVEVAA